MTAVKLPGPLDSELIGSHEPTVDVSEALNGDDVQARRKHKKRSKEERRKRSRSYSTDASCCSTSSKRKKKKKKHHRRSLDEPPSPKVNPIFLWVKEDNAKIVEVRCEDYDRRNRIKLTKTAGGWRAIPHVEIMEWQKPKIESEPVKIEPVTCKAEPNCFKVEQSDVHNEELRPIDDNLQTFKTEGVSKSRVSGMSRSETPPPQLEICKDDLIELMEDRQADLREMPPLERQTDYPENRTNDEVPTFVELGNDRVETPVELLELENDQIDRAICPEEKPEIDNKDEICDLNLNEEATTECEENNVLISGSELSQEGVGHVDEPDPNDNDVACRAEPNDDHEENQNDNQPAEIMDESTSIQEMSQESSESKVVCPEADDHEHIRVLAENQMVASECSTDHKEKYPESNNDKEKEVDSLEEVKQDCSMKCCDESDNVDENHNNEFDSDPRSSCMIEPSNFCQDVERILGAIENSSEARGGNADSNEQENCPKEVDEYDHSALMSELEEMMNERMKHDVAPQKDVLDDIYTFVPSPTLQDKPKPKDARPTSKIERVIEAVKAKSACAMAKANAAVVEKLPEAPHQEKLKSNELDNLDLLWRLPEGTTIHHSKLGVEKEPKSTPLQRALSDPCTTATISLVNPPTPGASAPPERLQTPVQDEPLNLGKPRQPIPPAVAPTIPVPQPYKKEVPPSCKMETKPDNEVNKSKSTPKPSERFTPDKSCEPLAQLKEIMSDPDVNVPDPLLVPKERLSALIANPKKEIPRLMAMAHAAKYPKLDTNLMEVSLAHLQLLLQSSKKDDELKFIQKHADLLKSHLKNDASSLDPATMSALNQMLWLPYLSHLDMGRTSNTQDLMGMMNMMYPYNAWGQQSYDYAQQSHLMNFWQDMAQKPNFSSTMPGNKGYNDLYKPIPPVNSPSLYTTSAPTLDGSRIPGVPYQPRQSKHSSSRRHHRSESLPVAGAIPDFLKPPHFDMAWSLPQTSEAGRISSMVTPSDRRQPRVEPSLPLPAVSSSPSVSSEPSPKLKVRKFDVDPNAVPKLINKNLTTPTLPPLSAMTRQVPSHYYDVNHLWNPLYAAPDTRDTNYTSSGHWNWTTPVTVSGK